MKKCFALLVASTVCVALTSVLHADKKDETVGPALKFTMKSIKGQPVDLSQYQGKVVLIVNVASECGLTPQYKDLEAIYEKYGKDGLVVLGFPANEFGKQEPGSDEAISSFCTSKYGVKFDMFSKVVVKGDGQCDLYKYLTAQKTAPQKEGEISWNFEKFLLNRQGEVVARFSPRVSPSDDKIVKTIEAELAKK